MDQDPMLQRIDDFVRKRAVTIDCTLLAAAVALAFGAKLFDSLTKGDALLATLTRIFS
jgi:hypothetical protein